jgi:hypothetical protein
MSACWCCARPSSGNTRAAPASAQINSRRLTRRSPARSPCSSPRNAATRMPRQCQDETAATEPEQECTVRICRDVGLASDCCPERVSDQSGPKKCVFNGVDISASRPVRQVKLLRRSSYWPIDDYAFAMCFFHLIFVLWDRRTDKAGYNDRDVLSFETRAEQ